MQASNLYTTSMTLAPIEKSFRMSLGADYARIVYSDWGDPSGEPLLCVHGLTGNGHDFNVLARALVPQGYRLLAIDVPGRGRSDFLTDPLDYNYKNYIAVLDALLVKEGLDYPASVTWLGVSMGGLLGIRMAGLSNSPVKRLILNDIGPEVPADDLKLISAYIKPLYEFENFDAFLQQVKATRGLSYGHLSDDLWEEMARGIHRTLPNGKSSYAYDPNIAEMFYHQPIGELSNWPFWDRITAPTLIIRGGKSTLFPQALADRMMQRGPGAKGLTTFQKFDDCGHVPSLMAAEHIALIENWLVKTSG